MSEVNSPCIRNCCLDEEEICMGCFRSLTEIMQWREVNEQEKLTIISDALERKEAHYSKRFRVVK